MGSQMSQKITTGYFVDWNGDVRSIERLGGGQAVDESAERRVSGHRPPPAGAAQEERHCLGAPWLARCLVAQQVVEEF